MEILNLSRIFQTSFVARGRGAASVTARESDGAPAEVPQPGGREGHGGGRAPFGRCPRPGTGSRPPLWSPRLPRAHSLARPRPASSAGAPRAPLRARYQLWYIDSDSPVRRRGRTRRCGSPALPPLRSAASPGEPPGRAPQRRLPAVPGPARLSAAAPRARLMAAAPPPPPPRAPSAGRGREPFPATPAGPGRSIATRPLTAGPARRFSRAGAAWAEQHTAMAAGRGELPPPVETTEPRRRRLFSSCQDLARGGGAHRAGGGEARWRWRWR